MVWTLGLGGAAPFIALSQWVVFTSHNEQSLASATLSAALVIAIHALFLAAALQLAERWAALFSVWFAAFFLTHPELELAANSRAACALLFGLTAAVCVLNTSRSRWHLVVVGALAAVASVGLAFGGGVATTSLWRRLSLLVGPAGTLSTLLWLPLLLAIAALLHTAARRRAGAAPRQAGATVVLLIWSALALGVLLIGSERASSSALFLAAPLLLLVAQLCGALLREAYRLGRIQRRALAALALLTIGWFCSTAANIYVESVAAAYLNDMATR